MESQAALTTLVMPPLAPLLGLLLALVLWLLPSSTVFAKLSLPLAILSVATLWISATPTFSYWLGKQVGQAPPQAEAVPQAVVVLGAGRYRDEKSGNERLSATSLERLMWAVDKGPGQLPVLVSGGRVYAGERDSEAQLMAAVMKERLQRPVTWQENCSRTTAENAVNSAAILHDSGVESIVLVTHWWHMPRAARVFARAGLQVQPLAVGAPGELLPRAQSGLLSWLPTASAMLRTQVYWRELLGQWWYYWRPLPPEHKC
ncbi:YdcF family protein [Microbulbifer flavimaris]|uniref:YdcF family protein n=1 Tax=Microbulbifer flavimaris TaxID=1781068 RepID=A0ABX4HZ94_9GAMM|nr:MULTISPECIES: YdcF family protein [Microbulbifer]PCO05472.1 YdcF family protein [Microbulbifer flavimaris]